MARKSQRSGRSQSKTGAGEATKHIYSVNSCTIKEI